RRSAKEGRYVGRDWSPLRGGVRKCRHRREGRLSCPRRLRLRLRVLTLLCLHQHVSHCPSTHSHVRSCPPIHSRVPNVPCADPPVHVPSTHDRPSTQSLPPHVHPPSTQLELLSPPTHCHPAPAPAKNESDPFPAPTSRRHRLPLLQHLALARDP
ncbi:hypothetical protein M427DRAFT_152889, partial [Gonapodya prolifera JEL478]